MNDSQDFCMHRLVVGSVAGRRLGLWLATVALVAGGCSNEPTAEDGTTGVQDTGVFDKDVKVGDTKKDTLDAEDTGPDGTYDPDGTDGGPVDPDAVVDGDSAVITDICTADCEAPDVVIEDVGDTVVPADVDVVVGVDTDSGQSPDVPTPKPGDFPLNPLPGEPGWPCQSGAECDFGFCVETAEGGKCTKGCDNQPSACPASWACKNVNQSTGDPIFGCVPKTVHMCDPCVDDKECQSGGDPTALCISYGDGGRFCGNSCASPLGKPDDSQCATGYYCMGNAKGTSGTSHQCMVTSGQCSCSKLAKDKGYSTDCQDKNSYGTCKGTRKCEPAGLTKCNAKAPTAEVCNGLDDNCDSATDEPGASLCTTFWKDVDTDGFGNSPATGGDNQCLCTATGLYSSKEPTDCDDANVAIKPTAQEICDGIDNNCDGKTDETCDEDKDGYCTADAIILPAPPGVKGACKYKGADCDDGNPKIHPGQPEICGNSADDNCDGATDDGATDAVGCVPYFEDADKDNVGKLAISQCLCAPAGIYTATVDGDCNDSNKNVFPGNQESCGNGIDDNCNGKQDEPGALNCTKFYKDADQDGFGFGASSCLCGPSATHTTAKDGDCNDSDDKMNPSMAEVCNVIDDDCDGVTDNNNATGCSTFYTDVDKDGFGNSKKFMCLCGPTDKWTATLGNDCDDLESKINPTATEVCDAQDNDCNGVIDDPGSTGCVSAFKDADGDTFGGSASKACVCGLLLPYNTFKGGDCDDKDKLSFPLAEEQCDGKDNNCNSIVDDPNAAGCILYYADGDGDGVGNSAKSKCLCGKDSTYMVTKFGDCNDNDQQMKPGLVEQCLDKKDNDCDGVVDNENASGCTNFLADADNDGYGDIMNGTRCLCQAEGIWKSMITGDCNDANNEISPSGKEKCDGKDNDCDGKVDPGGLYVVDGAVQYFADEDNDGWGNPAKSQTMCPGNLSYPYTSTSNFAQDCNDANPLISKGAFEVCGDEIDNNCNGQTDESVNNQLFYKDADKDGFGTGTGITACKPTMFNGVLYESTTVGDCNDALAGVNPNAQEICNGIDDDCNDLIDEQLAQVMCGFADNGVPSCNKGKCEPVCNPAWFNADGISSNGCECKADNFYGIAADTCATAMDLGYLYDDGATQIIRAGNLVPGETGDWFRVKAVDYPDPSGTCDGFNLRAWLNPNPDGKYTVDLYRGGCGAPQQLCGNETDVGWTVSFSGKSPYGPQTVKGTMSGDYEPSPLPEIGGECMCVNGKPFMPGVNYCTDNTADFYIRVGRQPGSGTICASYTLNVTNGKAP